MISTATKKENPILVDAIVDEYFDYKDSVKNGRRKSGWLQEIIKGSPYTNSAVGNIIQNIFNKFLVENNEFVRYIAGWGVDLSEINIKGNIGKKLETTVLTRVDVQDLESRIMKAIEYKTIRLNQNFIAELSKELLPQIKLQDKIVAVSVDICPYRDNCFHVMELKSSWDTDTGKTIKSVIQNVLLPYICLGYVNKQAYFGALSPIKVGKQQLSQLMRVVAPELVLIEEQLYDFVHPNGDFDYFKQVLARRIRRGCV
jgi:hypothetical protein